MKHSQRQVGRQLWFRLVACLFVVLASCIYSCNKSTDNAGSDAGDTAADGDADGDSDVDAGGDGDSDSDGQDALLDEFFSLARVHEIDISIDNGAYDSLVVSPKEYAPGSVSVDGTLYEEVGVRLKGSLGSFVPLEDDGNEFYKGNNKPGKSAFIVDFNRFVKGQKHLSLKKLTLNNMVQDPSGIHEFLGYTLFRAGGVPACRSGYAKVSFNGEEKGLYSLIETPDNREFLVKWFGSNKGNLYEGDSGSDLYYDRYFRFDQDSGDDTSQEDLLALTEALHGYATESEIIPLLEEYFSLDQFLAFAATELYLGHWDGYVWATNNFALHHDSEDGRWTFLPWGIDQLFDDGNLGNYAGVMKSPGPSWEPLPFGFSGFMQGGRIQKMCFESTECRARLADAFEDVIARVEEIDLAGLAGEARALVEPLLLEESTAHGDPNTTLYFLDGVDHYIANHPLEISEWLPCLRAGGSVDYDGDDFDGCREDCDDLNPEVYPGAPERCNVADDDCNAVLDDAEECEKCFEDDGPDGKTYSFCFEPASWYDARQVCLDRGQELVSIHDWETWEYTTFVMLTTVGAMEVWTGLNDQSSEGNFVWSDGSDLDFIHWMDDYPSADGDNADCVENIIAGWLDIPCPTERTFICREP